MKTTTTKSIIGIVVLTTLVTVINSCKSNSGLISSSKTDNDMILWYQQPGVKWTEAMPIGNGYMGAMVFGGINNERIALNESSFWSGVPHDYANPDAPKYINEIRDLIFADKFAEADKIVTEHFLGIPARQQSYQPLGDLLLNFSGSDSTKDYYRELDIEKGIIRITYSQNGARFTREIFMSYPDHAMVMRLTCNKPGRISLEARLKSPFLDETIAQPGNLVINGSWKGKISLKNEQNWIASVEGTGLKFQTALSAYPDNGQSSASDTSLIINKANSVTLILTAATSYKNYNDITADPAAACEKILAAIEGQDYRNLRNRHVTDFSGLMGRLELTIGDQSLNEKPTDERLKQVREGGADINLSAKCFQFGRYMLVSSSRIGGQPANLQGIWNESQTPPWGSKYTINVNTEENYWPAEVTNLSECHMPLLEAIKDLSVSGANTAKVHYGYDEGWVVHHNFDLWRGTAPVDLARSGMWPIGGSWLCQHIWEHYLYTGDIEFLKEYYPILKGSAQFLMKLMVEDPKHHWLVLPFSVSPEHGYFDSKGKETVLTLSTTMDIAIIRELFPHCIEAGKILNIDADFGEKLKEALVQIPPYQIGKDGALQEWIEDWQGNRAGHTISGCFPFFPGSSITLRGEPQLAESVQKWLEARPSGGLGFVSVWKIALWSRLENSYVTDSMIIKAFRGFGPSLFNSNKSQADANFGYSAAIAECLIQSHAGEISLLPALPASWKDGSVKGLCARGGFEVSMDWKDGRLTQYEIKSLLGNQFTVRYGNETATYNIPKGETLKIKGKV
jgi:alpha-L-fucosidase 2